MRSEFSGDDGEVVLSGFDENVEMENEEKGERGDSEGRVLREDAVVVEKAIGLWCAGGTRCDGGEE